MNKEKIPQSNNLLHGLTLEMILTDLVALLGWAKMGEKIPINCFLKDPSIKSSLAFLRKTPWARAKVEVMYQLNSTKITKLKAALAHAQLDKEQSLL